MGLFKKISNNNFFEDFALMLIEFPFIENS